MKQQNIQIRLADKNDIDTIAKFNAEMAWESENINLSMERLKKGVAGLFEDSRRGFYVVAECDGKVVGQTMITYEWSDWRNANFWWIQSVYVMPEYRRFGVFRSIVEHIKHKAEESSDVCGFRLYVSKYNSQAKKAYESMGMEMSYYEFYELSFE
jgi:GNAT superfamily N-acetyltransferase